MAGRTFCILWLRIYIQLGRPDEAEDLVMENLFFREARQRQDQQPVLNSKRFLAWIMTEQGHREAAERLQRSLLDISKRARGDGDGFVKALTNDSSLTLLHETATMEQKKEAITLLEKIVDAWKTPGGGETEKSLTVLNNLAAVYMDTEINRLEEAEVLLYQVIEGSAILNDENDQHSLSEKSNLAQIFARQGRWAEAEALDLEVLETRKHTLGMDNPVTIQCLSSIGWAYSQQEHRLHEVKTIQLEVLERRIRVQGANHPDTICILGNLAETCSKLGERAEARRYARLALSY